jgi:hypothetical protein
VGPWNSNSSFADWACESLSGWTVQIGPVQTRRGLEILDSLHGWLEFERDDIDAGVYGSPGHTGGKEIQFSYRICE